MKRTTLPTVTLACLVLAACSTAESPGADADPSAPTSTTTTSAAPAVVLTDAWVKALPEPGAMGMTGVFGTLTNTSSAPVTITGAQSSAAGRVELHETVGPAGSATMQAVEGGFVLSPGASRELKPGGDHVMLMDVTNPIPAGTTVTITLVGSDGSRFDVQAIAKSFTGGDEKYHSGSPSPTPGSSHSGSSATTPTS